MKSSCIPMPPGDRYVIIHKWAVDACKDAGKEDRCCAALIALMEFHHNGMQDNNDLFGNINFRYPMSLGKWAEELFGMFNVREIKKSLEFLEAKGFIDISEHPNVLLRGDRRRWYRLRPEAIIDWMIDNGRLQKSQIPSSSQTIENIHSSESDNEHHGQDAEMDNGQFRALEHDESADSSQTIENIHSSEIDNGLSRGVREEAEPEALINHHSSEMSIGSGVHSSDLHVVNLKKRSIKKEKKERENLTPNTESEDSSNDFTDHPGYVQNLLMDPAIITSVDRVLGNLKERLGLKADPYRCADVIRAVAKYGEKYFISEFNRWVAEAPNTPFHDENGARSRTFSNAIMTDSLYGRKLEQYRRCVAEWAPISNLSDATQILTKYGKNPLDWQFLGTDENGQPQFARRPR